MSVHPMSSDVTNEKPQQQKKLPPDFLYTHSFRSGKDAPAVNLSAHLHKLATPTTYKDSNSMMRSDQNEKITQLKGYYMPKVHHYSHTSTHSSMRLHQSVASIVEYQYHCMFLCRGGHLAEFHASVTVTVSHVEYCTHMTRELRFAHTNHHTKGFDGRVSFAHHGSRLCE